MSKKKNKNRLVLLLKLNSIPIERLKSETPQEYIYRVFQKANSELEEPFDVYIEGILSAMHIQYIKKKLFILPHRLHHFKNERFYLCTYYISRNTYGKDFFK